VSSLTAFRDLVSSVPTLGPLSAFAGTFRGVGFNTIFRPDNKVTSTPLPVPVPVFEPGQPPLIIPGETGAAGQPAPEFLVNPPISIEAPRQITVTAPQIQYSRRVLLNFNHLSWPHVSMATLPPASPVVIPPSAWA
jgi:hypothetical protein